MEKVSARHNKEGEEAVGSSKVGSRPRACGDPAGHDGGRQAREGALKHPCNWS